jgi:hypothetical protein
VIVRGGPKPVSATVRVVALYEPATGNIVHTHVVIVHEGGRYVADEEVMRTAVDQASRLGHPVDQLETKISTDFEHTTRPHRIDTETGEFVALETPELRARDSQGNRY